MKLLPCEGLKWSSFLGNESIIDLDEFIAQKKREWNARPDFSTGHTHQKIAIKQKNPNLAKGIFII